VKDENGDLLVDSHNTLNRWKKYFSQLLNMHNVSDVRQIEVHTAEPLVPGNEKIHQLFIDFKKVYDSVRREILYNILIEFGIPMKLG
jgi:hypothetical protein